MEARQSDLHPGPDPPPVYKAANLQFGSGVELVNNNIQWSGLSPNTSSFPYGLPPVSLIPSCCMTGPATLLKFLNYFLNREIGVSLQSVF